MYEKSKREIVISITYIRLPDVLVVGVKKCGTGAIMQQLGIHLQMSCPEYGLEENFAQDLFYNNLSYWVTSMPSATFRTVLSSIYTMNTITNNPMSGCYHIVQISRQKNTIHPEKNRNKSKIGRMPSSFIADRFITHLHSVIIVNFCGQIS